VSYADLLQQVVLSHLLAQHHIVRIFVKLDAPGVVLPPDTAGPEGYVQLDIGHNMPVPINGLRFTDFGIYGTFSFNRVPQDCVIPWTSLGAIVVPDAQIVFKVMLDGVPGGEEDHMEPAANRPSLSLVKS